MRLPSHWFCLGHSKEAIKLNCHVIESTRTNLSGSIRGVWNVSIREEVVERVQIVVSSSNALQIISTRETDKFCNQLLE